MDWTAVLTGVGVEVAFLGAFIAFRYRGRVRALVWGFLYDLLNGRPDE
jgi:hypothetical protein